MSRSYRLRRSFEKNAPEARALATGRMPSFTIPLGGSRVRDVPVFCFHDVRPESFATQLEFLRKNNYRCLDADEVAARAGRVAGSEREVALSFDDATWTFWTYAFPLLREYDFKAILFSVPTSLSADETERPTWEDYMEGRCPLVELTQREYTQPFCSWRELRVMHASGIVDVQSHTHTHARVPVSPMVIDFVQPEFDPYYGNFNVPLTTLDDWERPERVFRLGSPLFRSAPRLSGRNRFRESFQLVEDLVGAVEGGGGKRFFQRRGWRGSLRSILKSYPLEDRGAYETAAQTEAAVSLEVVRSKARLEKELPGKIVRHLAYPWFTGSNLAERLAGEAGYVSVFGGPDTSTASPTSDRLVRVQRVGEEYLPRLPGTGRRSLWAVWKQRLGLNRSDASR